VRSQHTENAHAIQGGGLVPFDSNCGPAAGCHRLATGAGRHCQIGILAKHHVSRRYEWSSEDAVLNWHSLWLEGAEELVPDAQDCTEVLVQVRIVAAVMDSVVTWHDKEALEDAPWLRREQLGVLSDRYQRRDDVDADHKTKIDANQRHPQGRWNLVEVLHPRHSHGNRWRHLLKRVMNRMRCPQNCNTVLNSVNAVRDKITHQEDRYPDQGVPKVEVEESELKEEHVDWQRYAISDQLLAAHEGESRNCGEPPLTIRDRVASDEPMGNFQKHCCYCANSEDPRGVVDEGEPKFHHLIVNEKGQSYYPVFPLDPPGARVTQASRIEKAPAVVSNERSAYLGGGPFA